MFDGGGQESGKCAGDFAGGFLEKGGVQFGEFGGYAEISEGVESLNDIWVFFIDTYLLHSFFGALVHDRWACMLNGVSGVSERSRDHFTYFTL